MLAALLIITSCATSLVEGILIKKYNSKYDKGGFFFTAMVSFFAMLFFVIYGFIDKGMLEFKAVMLPYGLVSGFLYCVASLLTFVALGCGPFAMSMLVLSYSGVFSIGYGVMFLNETLSPFKVIGILLIFTSLFLNRAKKKAEEKKASLKWLVCIGVSVVGSGMYGVIQKMQQVRFNNAYDSEFMIVGLGFSAFILIIVGLLKDGKDTVTIFENGVPYFSFAGISNGITNALTLAINLVVTAISIASPIRAGAKIIFSFAVSLVLFKEKFLKRQIAAVIVGAAALVFLNLKI